MDAAAARNDSRFLVDGDEEVGLVVGAAGFAFGFDLPVGGWRVGKGSGELVGRETELNRNFGADQIGEAIVVESDDVFVEFVADDLGAAIIPRAGGDVAFLDATQGEGERVDGGEMVRSPQTGAQGAAEKIRELIVGEEAVAIAEQVAQHLRPAYPENEADQREEAGDDEEEPGATLRVADPKERHKKRVPDEGAEETAEHGVEGGEIDAFLAPVKIEEPGLAGSLRGFSFVDRFADHAADAVGEEEEACGEEHCSEDGDEPDGRVVAGLDDVEGGEADEDACDQEGQAEENRRAAVDCGGALRGIVCQRGRHTGAAAEHSLLEGAGVFGGGSDGDGHGWRLLARVPMALGGRNRTMRKRYTVLVGWDGWAG